MHTVVEIDIFVGRGSLSGRGSRDMDYACKQPPGDDDRPADMQRPMRTLPKKTNM